MSKEIVAIFLCFSLYKFTNSNTVSNTKHFMNTKNKEQSKKFQITCGDYDKYRVIKLFMNISEFMFYKYFQDHYKLLQTYLLLTCEQKI